MLESVIDCPPIPAEGSAALLALEPTAAAPAGWVGTKSNDLRNPGMRLQTLRVGTAEIFHGTGTRSSADLLDLKIGLKPYHTNGLQLPRQQWIAEAPFFELGRGR